MWLSPFSLPVRCRGWRFFMGAGIAALAFCRFLEAPRAGPGPPGRDGQWPRKRRKALDTRYWSSPHALARSAWLAAYAVPARADVTPRRTAVIVAPQRPTVSHQKREGGQAPPPGLW